MNVTADQWLMQLNISTGLKTLDVVFFKLRTILFHVCGSETLEISAFRLAFQFEDHELTC